MGYYYEKAKSKKDLNEEQQKRYEALRSSAFADLPPALRERIKFVKEYVGPVASGEVWAAYEELVQDAFVVWVLASERHPTMVEWKNPEDLVVPLPPPTEEERKETEEWLKNLRADREHVLPRRRTWQEVLSDFLRRWM